MLSDINVGLAIIGAVVSALVGLISGVAVASWWLGTKNKEHADLIVTVQQIKDGCPNQHAQLVQQLKDVVCSGFKLAIAELGGDIERKLSGRDATIATQGKDTAVLAERVRQAELDIEAIFVLLNRRNGDRGRLDGDRRGNQSEEPS